MTDTDHIRAAVPIAELVREYGVNLKKVGVSLVGLCPFHREKTPSFVVSPAKNVFHCKGCGFGGDAFTFVQSIEGVPFRRALEILADRAGITLDPAAPAETDAERKARLRDLEVIEVWRAHMIVALSAEYHETAATIRRCDAIHERTMRWAVANQDKPGFDETRGFERAWRIWTALGILERHLELLNAAVNAIRGARQGEILSAFRSLSRDRQKEIRAESKHCDDIAYMLGGAIGMAQSADRAAQTTQEPA